MASCPGPPVNGDTRLNHDIMAGRMSMAAAHLVVQAEGKQAEGSFLSGLPLGPSVSERELILLYGLTRSEAALATRLLQGKSIDTAAAELSISAQVARAHLKRILMKTDARHVDRSMRDRTPALQS